MSLRAPARTVARLAVVLVALVAVTTSTVRGRQVVFRGTVDSVQLDVSVTSKKVSVANLTPDDFIVTDNGVRQTVTSLTYERLPIDVTLAADVSGSVAGPLLAHLVAGANTVRRHLSPTDRLAVVTFSHRVRQTVDFTTAPALGTLAIGPAAGSTSFYDALVFALTAPPSVDRRQMVIGFTDGLDTTSFLGAHDVLDVAGRSPAAVFMVTSAFEARVPGNFFETLSNETGGFLQVIDLVSMTVGTLASSGTILVQTGNAFAPSSTSAIDDSFLRALDDFRTRYSVRYTLTGVPRDGWHDVTIKIARPGSFQVKAKRGYRGG